MLEDETIFSNDDDVVDKIVHYIIEKEDDCHQNDRNDTTHESDCDSNAISPLKVHGFTSEPPSPDDISDITEDDSDFKLDSLDLIKPLASFKVSSSLSPLSSL